MGPARLDTSDKLFRCMEYHFAPLSEEHRQPVIDLFNHYVSHSYAAFPEVPVSYDFFNRFLEMTHGYPAIIAKEALGKVVGFAFLRPYHFAETFRRTAEITYFIQPDHIRRGLGTAFLEHLVRAARSMGLAIAGVDMLQSSRGPLVLEVNSSPGLEGIEKSTGVDIAGKIIEYVEEAVSRKRRPKDRVKA